MIVVNIVVAIHFERNTTIGTSPALDAHASVGTVLERTLAVSGASILAASWNANISVHTLLPYEVMSAATQGGFTFSNVTTLLWGNHNMWNTLQYSCLKIVETTKQYLQYICVLFLQVLLFHNT